MTATAYSGDRKAGDKIVGAGQLGKDSRDQTTGEDSQERTTMTGKGRQYDQNFRTGQLGQGQGQGTNRQLLHYCLGINIFIFI
jgi:hypothetical protein